MVRTAYGYIRFLKVEFGFILAGLAITFAFYVALYLVSYRAPAQRSLRGFVNYVFPFEVFRHARIDFIAYMLGKLAWAPIVAKLVVFIAIDAAALDFLNACVGQRALVATNSWLALSMQFLVYYFAYNFPYYWAHRALHETRFLWSVHRVHHSAETLTFLTAGGRVHPIESVGVAVWTTLWTGCAAAALSYYTGTAMHPLFPAAVFFCLLLTDVLDKLQHWHVRTTLGPLNYIFPSGEMHQIHHSAELKHRDKNFGNGSSLFDWIFGTIYIPKPDETIRVG